MQLAFLLFEADYGARCTASQIRLFRGLMLNPENREAIDSFQARMGSGKTTLFPLLALVQIAREGLLHPDRRSLVRYVVPSAVLPDNEAAFDGRLSAIFGSSVIRDGPFSRYQINPAERAGSFRWILEDLTQRLDFYRNVRDQSLVLIQSPDIRHCMEAQELAFGFLLIGTTLSDEERVLCMQCKQQLGRIRSMKTCTFFDELDSVQNFRDEVNFTEGKKIAINPHTIRPLRTLIDCIARHHALPPRALATNMLRASRLPEDDRILDYVTDRAQPITTINGLEAHLRGEDPNLAPERYASVFLIRAFLLDPNILSLAHEKQPRTHFGVRYALEGGVRTYSFDPESGSALLIAVPYDGGKPKGLSSYENTEVAATTTMRLYSSPETQLDQDPHLDFLITQTRKGSIPEDFSGIVAGVRNPEGRLFSDRLRALSRLLDPAEIKQAKEKFHQEFLQNPDPAVRTYFGMAVVATQVRSDEGRANSNRYEMGGPDDQNRGCSGTVEGTSCYFEKPEQDPAADGIMSLEIMGREENAATVTLREPRADQDYLDEVLSSLLEHAKPETRALIDVAGICKSRDGTPEAVVAHLWILLQRHPRIRGISGIIYYGNDNVKRIYRGPGRPPIPCTTEMELAALHDRRYFSFYGQKNTRGSDIKQANGIHAQVTMDINVPNTDAKQAILRLRNLIQRSSGQTFTFALTADFVKKLRTNIIATLLEETRVAIATEARARARAAAATAAAAAQRGNAERARQFTEEAAAAAAEATAAAAKASAAERRRAYVEAAAAAAEAAEAAAAGRQDLAARARAAATAAEERAAAMVPRRERPEETAKRRAKEASITARDVATDLRLRERAQEESDALLLFGKELKAHVKQAAAHLEHRLFCEQDMRALMTQTAYRTFLTERDRITPLLERALVALEEKYGGSVRRVNRNAYIAEQTHAAIQQLEALRVLFTRTRDELRIQRLQHRLDFFVARIARSRTLFESRYRQLTLEAATVDTAAQAVAMALAQAQAQALAQAVAERIAQSVVHAEPRIDYPRLTMTTAPLFIPNPAWFANPTGVSVDGFDHLKHLIRPDLRGQVHLSPHLQERRIVSHFALVPKDRSRPFLFVSQEEADQWCSRGQRDFDLFDLRNPHRDLDAHPIFHNMKAAVLQTRPTLPRPTTTEGLRRAPDLRTLVPRQLLPTLGVTGDLSRFLDLTTFGIRAESRPLDVSFNKDDRKFTIAVGHTGVAIPTTNEWLSPLFEEIYGGTPPWVTTDKFPALQEAHRRRSEAFRRQLAELERQQAELRRRQEEMYRRIRDASAFTISDDLERGLRERDAEATRLPYGNAFLTKLEEIRKIQADIESTPSLANLAILERKFQEFVSDDLLGDTDYTVTPAFDKTRWDEHKATMPPTDQVYGRIVYEVNHGDPDLCRGAKRCSRDDCRELFNRTLPELKISIRQLRKTIAELPAVQEEITALQAQVDALNVRKQSLEEADRCLTDMVRFERDAIRTLLDHGIDFRDRHSLWDRFHFEHLAAWPQEQVRATLQGILPEYDRTVREGVQEYERRIHALTAAERDTQREHHRFHQSVLALAERVEPRPAEVAVTA